MQIQRKWPRIEPWGTLTQKRERKKEPAKETEKEYKIG